MKTVLGCDRRGENGRRFLEICDFGDDMEQKKAYEMDVAAVLDGQWGALGDRFTVPQLKRVQKSIDDLWSEGQWNYSNIKEAITEVL